MVVVAAERVEGGVAGRTTRVALEVFGDRQLSAAGSTKNAFLVPFTLRPHFDGVACEGVVAVFAGVVGGAAIHFDGDDVGGTVVVKAAGLGVEVEAADFGIG